MLRNKLAVPAKMRTKCLLCLIVLIILSAFAASARAWFVPTTAFLLASGNPSTEAPGVATQSHKRRRNLSLRPEAFNFSRRVGRRFNAPGRERATMIGTLNVGTEQHDIVITRLQGDEGEGVTVSLDGGAPLISWDQAQHEQGAGETGARASVRQRALMERLVLDSPDQFVLAQLRGASYNTVLHSARPVEAGGADDYTGAVYDVVRVSEPRREHVAGNVRWQLFYLNTQTGLVEKIVSEDDGARVEAAFTEWDEQDGEQFPRRIRWSRLGQPLMELTITGLSYLPAS
jgi:hypothetical protein